jgi:hypothetical protein
MGGAAFLPEFDVSRPTLNSSIPSFFVIFVKLDKFVQIESATVLQSQSAHPAQHQSSISSVAAPKNEPVNISSDDLTFNAPFPEASDMLRKSTKSGRFPIYRKALSMHFPPICRIDSHQSVSSSRRSIQHRAVFRRSPLVCRVNFRRTTLRRSVRGSAYQSGTRGACLFLSIYLAASNSLLYICYRPTR